MYSKNALYQQQNARKTIKSFLSEGPEAYQTKLLGRMQFHDPANNISVITEDGKVVTVMYGKVN